VKKLSESLADLQAKATEVRDSAKQMIDESQAKLEERRRRVEAAMSAQRERVDASIDRMETSARRRAQEIRDAVDRQYQEVSQDIARRRAERDVTSAEDAAHLAEDYATSVSELARFTLNHAEAAAISAAQARAEATKLREDLGAAPQGVA
jgi:hypothetical protein